MPRVVCVLCGPILRQDGFVTSYVWIWSTGSPFGIPRRRRPTRTLVTPHTTDVTLNQRSKALNPEMHSPPRRTPTWLYAGQSLCMQPAFAVPPPVRQAAAHEEPCVFFVRLVDSRLSTCSNVCELSMICHVASRARGEYGSA